MANRPLSNGVSTENFAGIASVPHEKVDRRARDLTLLTGSATQRRRPSHHAQAKCELPYGTDIDRHVTALESLSEAERWDPAPDSKGRQTPAVSSCLYCRENGALNTNLMHATHDLNIICFGGLVVGHATAGELVRTFLAARFSGAERHRRRLAKVAKPECEPAKVG